MARSTTAKTISVGVNGFLPFFLHGLQHGINSQTERTVVLEIFLLPSNGSFATHGKERDIPCCNNNDIMPENYFDKPFLISHSSSNPANLSLFKSCIRKCVLP